MVKDLRVVQKLVDMAVGIDRFTYQMNRNAPRPNGDYAAVRLRRTYSKGYDSVYYIPTPDGIIYRTKGLRILEFDILFSRDDIEIDVFNNSFQRPDIHLYLEKEGYALMERTSLNIKDTKFETDWEVRTGVTIMMSTIRQVDTLIDNIEVVEIVDNKYYEGSQVTEIGNIKIGDKE